MLVVKDIAKAFGAGRDAVKAVEAASFEVKAGTFFGILGASGCGKTTLLRIIAGLEIPDSGEVSIDGTVVLQTQRRINRQPHRRPLSLVFQSYAIWPHLSVFENAAFPLRVRRADAKTVKREVERVLASVALSDLAGRVATTLSGGQQQRLALARAIVAKPKLLLLDEPLSNLDAKLRETMRVELRRLQAEENLTAVFVTHDQTEGLSLADTVAVMDKGRFLQIDAPRAVYDRPISVKVASFIGSINQVPARATGRRDAAGNAIFASPWGDLAIAGRAAMPAGESAILGVRPERISIGAGSRVNVLSGEVRSVMYYGDHQRVFLALADGSMVDAIAPADFAIAKSQRLELSVDPADFRVLLP